MPRSRLATPILILAAALPFGGHALAADAAPEKAALCATCHGEQGIPINKQTPVIWGQNEGYSICSCATSRVAPARMR